jgi:hypothetical protein
MTGPCRDTYLSVVVVHTFTKLLHITVPVCRVNDLLIYNYDFLSVTILSKVLLHCPTRIVLADEER